MFFFCLYKLVYVGLHRNKQTGLLTLTGHVFLFAQFAQTSSDLVL